MEGDEDEEVVVRTAGSTGLNTAQNDPPRDLRCLTQLAGGLPALTPVVIVSLALMAGWIG